MAIIIPGLKVLDEVLAGLPTNSRLREQVGELKAQIAVLAEEKEALKAELEKLEPKAGLPIDTVKVLQYFFREDRKFTAEQVARHFGMHTNVGTYHCDTLRKKALIGYAGPIVVYDGSPMYLGITPQGRAYVVENGLA